MTTTRTECNGYFTTSNNRQVTYTADSPLDLGEDVAEDVTSTKFGAIRTKAALKALSLEAERELARVLAWGGWDNEAEIAVLRELAEGAEEAFRGRAAIERRWNDQTRSGEIRVLALVKFYDQPRGLLKAHAPHDLRLAVVMTENTQHVAV